MAQEWCLAYGILDHDSAVELLQKINKRKGKASNTPIKKEIKKEIPVQKPRPAQQRKAIIYDDDANADTGNIYLTIFVICI